MTLRREPRTVSTRQRLALVVLVMLAAGEFVARGPLRALTTGAGFNDLLAPYVQTRAWIHGADPYSPQSLLKFWPAEASQLEFLPKEVADGSILAKRGIPTAYPVPSFVLLAPLALLPWHIANGLWTLLNTAFFLVMCWALASLAGRSREQARFYVFLAFVLALAPFHTGIATGNLSVLAIELGVIAAWVVHGNHDVAAGLLFGLAIALKPPIGACLLAYYVLRGRWRVMGTAAGVLILLSAVATLRLHFSEVDWTHSYAADNRALFATGILSDFRPDNPTRFGLVNLQVVFYPLVRNAANAVAMATAGLLLGFWIWLGVKRHDNELLPLGAIAALSLLPIYHRFYDAGLLVLALAWYMSSGRKAPRFIQLPGLALLIPFLLPGGSLLETLVDSGRIPTAIARSWWWNLLIMPHAVWCVLVLSILLLCEMWWVANSKLHARPGI